MPITMDQVLNQLDREEPDYLKAARLGPEALPHLITLIKGENAGLASKATYLAGFINAAESTEALEKAAQHPDPIVRVAAAASARHLTNVPPPLMLNLLNDSDVGVRKWALKTLEVHRLPGIRTKVEEIMKCDPDIGLRDKAKHIINELP
jgi:HEAT repeat protein